MCGIAGFFSQHFNETTLAELNDAQQHRGPDNSGHYYEPQQHIGLTHNRLSILDLSAEANQPFESSCGRYIMVYNGEVYNYSEIKKSLPLSNWRTNGDTEVLIEAFALWGPEFVKKLNGMFSIAIWDKEKRSLFVARDRIGIKPLFLLEKDGGFMFSSELKAIKRCSEKELNVDPVSISQFLHYGYIPGPRTIYKEVTKFPVGTYAIIKSGKIEYTSYWDLQKQITPTTLKDDYISNKNTLHHLLSDSIEKRLISDVPVGTFLSGGIDSSLVTAIAQKRSEKRIKSFSIGFKEAKFNESKYAKAVAKHVGTDHHEFILTEQNAIERVDKLLNIYDEPYADSSALPTLLVSEQTKKHVTVALSGDGGDELFQGYGMYNWAKRLSNPLFSYFRKPISSLLLQSGNQRLIRGSSLFNYSNTEEVKSHIFSQEQYLFSTREIETLVKSHSKSFGVNESFALSRSVTPAEEQALFDLMYYLPDDLLVKVDRASMHYSLEVRVPILDHRVVDFALNLPISHKTAGKNTKRILKDILYEYVPKELFERPKHGFSIPLVKWLKTDLKYLIDNYLSEETVRTLGIVNWLPTKELVSKYLNGEDYLYNRVWALVILHKWMKE